MGIPFSVYLDYSAFSTNTSPNAPGPICVLIVAPMGITSSSPQAMPAAFSLRTNARQFYGVWE